MQNSRTSLAFLLIHSRVEKHVTLSSCSIATMPTVHEISEASVVMLPRIVFVTTDPSSPEGHWLVVECETRSQGSTDKKKKKKWNAIEVIYTKEPCNNLHKNTFEVRLQDVNEHTQIF
jgi:hypothetical protein